MYGVIDIGSNTIRLVIYKIEDGKIESVLNKKCSVGLAGYIDKNNLLKPSGVLKTVESLEEFQEILDYMQVTEVYAFATASLRNIDNSLEVINYLKEKTKFDVRILTGEEEATFDYYGAIKTTDSTEGLMIDIGGGSTEFVFYSDNKLIKALSLPIGSLNLFNKYVEEILPTKKEISQIEKEIKRHLKTIDFPENISLDTVCCVGGSSRAVLKLLKSKSKLNILNSEYPSKHLEILLDLANNDPQKLSKQILKVAPDRIHTFIPGFVILNTIATYCKNKNIVTSNYGVREGYLHYILEKKGLLNE